MIHTLKQKLKNAWLNFYFFTLGKYLRILKKPSLPKNKDGRVLIHVGCGTCANASYINVDTRPGIHVHYIEKIENLPSLFPPEYADLIYACHILEHLRYAHIPSTLKKVRHALKSGGVFRISVPDFAVIVAMYQERRALADIMPPLMGGQGYADNCHYSAFDKTYLTALLHETGFTSVREWNPKTTPDYTFDDWAGRTFPLYGKQWPISLNLEATK